MDENGHETAMKDLTHKLELSRVSFPGAVFGRDKDALYRSADLFVLPTHPENFGLVVAEALAQEVPVITTTNAPWAGLREQGCGWWIDLGQEQPFDTMWLAMRCPPEQLAGMGQKGRTWMQRDFAASHVSEKMREVYLWATGRGSKPDTIND